VRVLVTGGTGFIGEAVVQSLLERDWTVQVLTAAWDTSEPRKASTVTYAVGDLADSAGLERAIREFAPDFVVHLAWEGLPDYSMELCRRNLAHGVNVFTASVRAGCNNLLAAGTCWEYAQRRGCLSEGAPLETGQVFAAVKTALRIYGQAVAQAHGGRLYWLRLFYVYGPGQRRTSLIPHIAGSLREGKSPQCRSPGHRNDFVHVEDVARAVVSVLDAQPPGSVYNVGSGASTEVREVIRLVRDAIPWPSPSPALPETTGAAQEAGAEAVDFWADIRRLSEDTGWAPAYSLAAGIEATLAGMGTT